MRPNYANSCISMTTVCSWHRSWCCRILFELHFQSPFSFQPFIQCDASHRSSPNAMHVPELNVYKSRKVNTKQHMMCILWTSWNWNRQSKDDCSLFQMGHICELVIMRPHAILNLAFVLLKVFGTSQTRTTWICRMHQVLSALTFLVS